MVGTLRSTGCDTCRKRKKKCGEEIPECLACVNAGWKCPGYVKRWKFVNENRPIASLYRKKKYIFEDVDDSRSVDSRAVLFKRHEIYHNWDISVGTSLCFPHEQACKTLCYILENPQPQKSFPIRSFGSFFPMIPARLGHNIALDNAVACLCSMYTDSLVHTPASSKVSVQLYARSLRSLRERLEFPEVTNNSEMICASIILQICELSMNNDVGRWNQLCMGSKFLIQSCDPRRFLAPFERAMLESQRAWFIVQDANAGRKCFLSNPQWRELLRIPLEHTVSGEHQSISLRSELCDFLVDVPSLILEVSRFSDSSMMCCTDSAARAEQCEIVYRQISAFKHTIETWYSTSIVPQYTMSLSTSNTSLGGKKDRLGQSQVLPCGNQLDVLLAVVDCLSNAIMLRLDMLLAKLASILEYDLTGSGDSNSILLQRRIAVSQSLEFIKGSSHVAAKPLKFGLQQLWSNDYMPDPDNHHDPQPEELL